jgi:asparagine synthase (glutamine-hydrolysing)
VALSGDGGDELFGGYETYVADQFSQVYDHIPAFFRHQLIEPFIRSLTPRPAKKGLVNKAIRFVQGQEHARDLSHARWRIFTGKGFADKLFTPEALAEISKVENTHILKLFRRAGGRDAVNRNLYVDLKSYLCDNCLVKADRMSMAVSLETRVPLLDRKLVELAFRIPGRLKVNRGHTKVLLKKVAARQVPRSCVYRPKQGFSIPIKNWLKSNLKPMMEDLLQPYDLQHQGLFRPDTIARLKQEHLSGAANHSHILWSLMVFQAWKRMWLDR